MLTGRFRRGSGITGSGGEAEVAPVVIGPLFGSDALIWTPTRPFGAGLGIGTVCAVDGVTRPDMEATISNARAVRARGPANCSVIRSLAFLFNASSCRAFSHFIVVRQREISFFRENMLPNPARDVSQKRLSSSSTRISRFPA